MSSAPALSYSEFLESKRPRLIERGEPIHARDIHPILKPHQRAIVEWAVRGGRRAIFAAFGLGKTIMQLEILRLLLAVLDLAAGQPRAKALIVCPLGVRAEFVNDARKLGITVRFVRRSSEVDEPGIYLANYESVRDGLLDPNLFNVASLDEASILRSYGSKTFREFLTLFDQVPYRFVATATPSPNKYKELLHYAEFLGVMDVGQALTRFFQRDSQHAGELTLHPHKEQEFWLWLSSWAVFLQSPADLGFDATGYELPPLDIDYVEVSTAGLDAGADRDGQQRLIAGASLGVGDAAREKRRTLDVRVAEMMRILTRAGYCRPPGSRFNVGAARARTTDQVVIWCDLNDEQRAIEKALTNAGISYSSVYGSLSIDETERRIDQWKRGETTALIGKPVMLGQGLNLQQCNRAVFVGLTHKFNQVIQATHRIWRFGQTRRCWVHIIHADTERPVVAVIKDKWLRHEELTKVMSDLIRLHGLNDIGVNEQLLRSMGVDRVEVSGDGWTVVNNDCVVETADMPDNSVHLIVTSIPFSNHYEYTPSYNDFGHTDDNDHFWAQMDFLTPQLHRVLRPGRIYACHVKDRILYGNVTGRGYSTVSPFHAEALMHGIKHGFDYLGMITVVTDVVRENNQSYRLGWTENSKDSTRMGVGSPEYILLFRKPQSDRSRGYADQPVTKDKAEYSRSRWQVDAHAFWRSNGDRGVTPDEWIQLAPDEAHRAFRDMTLEEVYDLTAHVRIGEAFDTVGRLPSTFMMLAPGSWHPDVWHDVVRMRTLNGEQSRKAQALHVCPLQFDIVDRLIERYSNPDEIVYDPFGGLFTVPYRALALGRQGRAVELNASYFLDGVKYLQAIEAKKKLPTLFDIAGGDEPTELVALNTVDDLDDVDDEDVA